MTTIVRRLKLGKTSVKEICQRSQTGIKWVRSDGDLPSDDIYIRWGCTANVPSEKIINSAKAIHKVNDKRAFRAELDSLALCTPTWMSYDEFVNSGYNEFAKSQKTGFGKVIVRPRTHSRGRGMWVAESLEDLKAICNKLTVGGYYMNLFVNKVAEYRVFVIQGRVAWVASKTPKNAQDIAWNVAKGGSFENVKWGDWPLEVCKVAIEAWSLSGLHFGGVDVMVDSNGTAYVLEINSAPSLTSPYRQDATAKAFDWMCTNTTDVAPKFDSKDYGNWRDYIHPGLWPRTRTVGVQEEN